MLHVYKTDNGIMSLGSDSRRPFDGLDVEFRELPSTTEEELIRNCRDASGLVVVGEPITRRVLENLPSLKVVARCGVGVDVVDVDAATELGVQVTNVPDGNYNEVAAHALGLILNHTRRIASFDADVRAQGWNVMKIGATIRRESTQKIGLIGFGRIGQRLASMASAVGFRVQAYDPFLTDERISAAGAQPCGLDELLESSDVLSLHVPLTPDTHHLIDAGVLGRVREGAILINVARGGLVDEDALAAALVSGRLGGAALDVFEVEPLPASSPLRSAPKLTLTPHVAFLSADSLEEVGAKAMGEVAAVLHGQAPAYPVNTPAGQR